MQMSKLSRRSLVTSAAALPVAAAVPALALPAVAVDFESGADGRLVALAKEVFEAWNALGEACERTGAAYEASSADYHAAEAAQNAVSERLHAAVDAMRGICARSVCGLAAKARVADLLMRDENGEPHSDGQTVWMVVDDLLAMEGPAFAR
jgi:predicted secreted protein